MQWHVVFILITQIVICATVCPQCNNMPPQCPCVRAAGSTNCLSYDSTYLASTIDEAMFNFPNLASNTGQTAFSKESQQASSYLPQSASMMAGMRIQDISPMETDPECWTADCQACKLSILDGFLDHDNKNDTLWQEKNKLENQAGSSKLKCPIQKSVKKCKQKCQKKKDKQNEMKAEKIVSILKEDKRKKRGKRNINPQPTEKEKSLLGKANQILCDYKKGSELAGDGDWTGLCNLCWQWRRLPDEYFPNYINEVSCDSKDNSCLAGFGTCRAVLRVLNVLKNVGTREVPNYQQQTIESAAACECQVQVGTSLHALVQR